MTTPVTFMVYFTSFVPFRAYTLNEPLNVPFFGVYVSFSPERFAPFEEGHVHGLN